MRLQRKRSVCLMLFNAAKLASHRSNLHMTRLEGTGIFTSVTSRNISFSFVLKMRSSCREANQQNA